MVQRHGDDPPPPREITVFIVRDLETGDIVHHEHFASGDIPPGRFVSEVVGRAAALERKYRLPRYEVIQESFNSFEAFYHVYPQCRSRGRESGEGAVRQD